MKAQLYDLTGKKKSELTLPKQFNEEVRTDLIKKVVVAAQANKVQQRGAKERAGLEYSDRVSKKRRDFRGSYGHGISRVPRKVHLRRGTRFVWVGTTVSGTVGGRRAHPPKAEKIWKQKINNKERLKAIRSAISATINKEMLKDSGFNTFDSIVIENVEKIEKTKDLVKLLNSLKLEKELERSKEKKIRSGKGKLRGRKYRRKKGPLLVVSEDSPVLKAAKNIPGLDSSIVNFLNVELLAPGTRPGRLTIWSEKAIKRMEKEELYMASKSEIIKKVEKKEIKE